MEATYCLIDRRLQKGIENSHALLGFKLTASEQSLSETSDALAVCIFIFSGKKDQNLLKRKKIAWYLNYEISSEVTFSYNFK